MTGNGDNTLGAYLKDRRARLDPATFGFSSKRRRTPGLRREEVAQRARVSATWYTWLEQGRGGAPSADVLDRLATALALSETEREHLYLLALGHPPEVIEAAAGQVTVQLQRVLDGISHPSLIVTSTWDIVGWNSAAVALFGDFSVIPASRRNALHFTFAPGARERMTDWERHARGVVARFRAETVRAGTTDRAERLVAELSLSSPEFAAMWSERDVIERGPGIKRLSRGDDTLTFEYAAFAVRGSPDLQMIVYTPETLSGPAGAR